MCECSGTSNSHECGQAMAGNVHVQAVEQTADKKNISDCD